MSTERPVVNRALTFGAVAAAYERYRFGYPDELLRAIVAYTGSPPISAVEIGAGTGKATVALAELGLQMIAVEPDPQMRAVLTDRTAGFDGVRVEAGTFESYEPSAPVDLIVAATSWHWTDPETRWARAFRSLRAGGTIAILGNGSKFSDPSLDEQYKVLLDTYAREEHNGPWTTHPNDGLTWQSAELLTRPDFTALVERRITEVRSVSRESVLGHSGTTSTYLLLDPSARSFLLDRVAALLPDPVDLQLQSQLTLGRRR